ncbi:MAG: DUF1351 domain-containing protein [Sulfurimonas sp.]|jgi:hypothetical protein|nr:DUF1351 domain-containing protein [Sulfurimonas sp.]
MEIALLEDKKTIKQLVKVDTSIIDYITGELAKDEYNFVVTADNLVFAKAKMSDLNKSAKFIDTFRKDKVASESEDIDSFKTNVKEYLTLIDLKRESIKKDVAVFESEQKLSITKELGLYAEELIETYNLRFEFQKVDVSDLILLGSVTSKGALTKKASETIEGRVIACKSKQDKYDMRLMKLENLSLKSGLASPLTIVHVQGIINIESDEEYETKLDALIASEIERQDAVMESVAAKAKKDADSEAQEEVIKKQNRIRNIFKVNYGNMDLKTIELIIDDFNNHDIEQFNSYKEFAISCRDSEIAKLQNVKAGLIQKEEITKSSKVEVLHEVIQEPKFTPPVQNIEDDKKVVYIDVKLQFKVKHSVSELKILDKVKEMLSDAGFGESLLSVGLVS